MGMETACKANGVERLALAYACRVGNGVPADEAKAVALEREAAEAGSDDALWALALRYRHGIGLEKDAEKAFSCLCRIKEETGYVRGERAACLALMGQTELALDLYYLEWKLHGDGYAAAEFFRLLLKTNRRADAASYVCELAQEKYAESAFLPAAETLIDSGFAEGYYFKAQIMANSGWCETDEGVREALRLLAAAAELGYAPARAFACAIAAESDLEEEEIFAVYQAAADAGESEGFYRLAGLYRVNGDAARCDALMKKAAEAGHIAALCQTILEMRKAGIPDKAAYFTACKRAAEGGTGNGDEERTLVWYLLAEAYRYGIGVQRDTDLADEWYAKCRDRSYSLNRFMASLPKKNDALPHLAEFAKRFLLYDAAKFKAFLSVLKKVDRKLWKKLDAVYQRFERGQTYITVCDACGDRLTLRQERKLLKRAARLGNGSACEKLADEYDEELSKRIKYLKKGIRLDCPRCMFGLGYLYLKREELDKPAEGVAWTRRSYLRQKSLPALQNLGLQYEKGRGVPKDAGLAIDCYKRVFEECKDDASADAKRIRTACGTSVFLAYLSGNGVERDVRQAVLWLGRLVENGDANAMYNMGAICFDDSYDRENEALCKIWYEKAECSGYKSEDGDLYLNLGYFHQYGTLAGDRDLHQAIEYYKRAGEFEGSKAAACFNLGAIYSQELNDPESAIEWYEKSIDCEMDLSALNSLANCYTNKEAPDLETAEKLYEQIVEQAPPYSYKAGFALINLAENTADPRRKEIDRERARAYAVRAVEALTETIRRHERGENVEWSDYVYHNLAKIYLNGKWCARDLKKAQEYAVKGAKRGRRPAIRLCEKYGWKY